MGDEVSFFLLSPSFLPVSNIFYNSRAPFAMGFLSEFFIESKKVLVVTGDGYIAYTVPFWFLIFGLVCLDLIVWCPFLRLYVGICFVWFVSAILIGVLSVVFLFGL